MMVNQKYIWSWLNRLNQDKELEQAEQAHECLVFI